MNNFTTEDMIRYLYNEMSPEESLRAKECIDQDPELRELCSNLQASMSDLNTIRYSPNANSIERIMNYAGDKI